MSGAAIKALWRATRRRDWKAVEIVADHVSGQLVVREVGKFWPGVWLVPRDQVRITGPEFYPS